MCINITRLVGTVESHALTLDSDMTWIEHVNNGHLSPYKLVLMGFVKSNSNSKMVWKSIIDLEGIESPALEWHGLNTSYKCQASVTSKVDFYEERGYLDNKEFNVFASCFLIFIPCYIKFVFLDFTGLWESQWWPGKICRGVSSESLKKVPAWFRCRTCLGCCCSSSSCSCHSSCFGLCKCCALCSSWI